MTRTVINRDANSDQLAIREGVPVYESDSLVALLDALGYRCQVINETDGSVEVLRQ